MQRQICLLLLCFSICYGQVCSDICDGCTDTGPEFCTACITNASKAIVDNKEICKCDPGYWGDACDNRCSLMCYECAGGSTAEDCTICALNASFATTNNGQECQCNTGWAGANCSHYDTNTADCHPLCMDNKCTSGPTADKCIDCVQHASWKSGFCACDDDWTGEKCDKMIEKYFGSTYQTHNNMGGHTTSYQHGYQTSDGQNTIYNHGQTATNMFNQPVYTMQNTAPLYTNSSNAPIYTDTNHSHSANTPYHTHGVQTNPVSYTTSYPTQYPTSYTSSAFTAYPNTYNYSGYTCHAMCGGHCHGPLAYDCDDCCTTAHMDTYGHCECNYGYSGDACLSMSSYNCSPMCYGGCTGPYPTDCTDCTIHSYRDDYNFCICESYWSGDDCAIYRGPCDSKCYGCNGPDANDCRYCVPHAHWNNDQECECDAEWEGDDCSTWNGTCDIKCATDECAGPTASDCTVCIDHASWDMYGYCICDSYWVGTDCSEYKGPCDERCLGCTGPSNTQCTYCGPHAVLDSDTNACECTTDWSGSDCQTFDGTCHSRCLAGTSCMGETSSDCNYCNENATWDSYRNCVCLDNWTGDDCMTYTGKCDPKCHYCTGPFSGDCTVCVANATKDSHDFCVCDVDWYGDDCSVYKGECDPICGDCHGPEACDCDYCVQHAHWDTSFMCECDANWGGVDCQTFTGDCHPKCYQTAGCTGVTAEHCKLCGLHAHRDQNGLCTCDNNWGGMDCSIYLGECHPMCIGCDGPDDCDCKKCVEHAKMDSNFGGTCFCLDDWSGEKCETYDGICSPKCASTCTGPHACDCDACVAHAEQDPSNNMNCVCEDDWGMDDCSVYIGMCYKLCDGCDGPLSTDCRGCVADAYKNAKEECVCDQYFTGHDCTIYQGPCDPKCAGGCYGPEASRCERCIEHAARSDVKSESAIGTCDCHDNWSGDDCQTYIGKCHPSCMVGPGRANGPIDCYNENPDGCNECKEHAHRDDYGACLCDADWAMTEIASAYDNVDENAIWRCDYSEELKNHDSDDQHWSGCLGSDDEYDSTCRGAFDWDTVDPDVVWVSGDTGTQWVEIQFTHHMSITGVGVKIRTQGSISSLKLIYDNGHSEDLTLHQTATTSDIGGNTTVYDHPTQTLRIEILSGSPGAGGVYDAAFEITGSTCIIKNTQTYGKANCDTYEGACYSRCAQCSGPDFNNCTQCRGHSTFVNDPEGPDGYCVCEDDWAGPTCEEYNGLCDRHCRTCWGPDQDQCIECTENTHERQDTSWTCECDDDYVDHLTDGSCTDVHCTCTDYDQSLCDNPCSACTGQSKEECTDCHPHAYRNEFGLCTCHPDWQSENCATYIGECDKRCYSCTGPSNSECVECSLNATSSDGDCVCDTDFTGHNCLLYQGECNPICKGCFNRRDDTWSDVDQTTDCYDCVQNAHWEHIQGGYPYCVCDDQWSGDDCSAYNQSDCYHTCNGCRGPLQKDCNSCVTNAYRNSDGICVCKPGWETEGCDTWAGLCDHRCMDCLGPSNTDCGDGCVSHTLVDVSNGCLCEAEWRGQHCQRYAGPCHANCYGCHGPSDTECEYCITHAYEDILGACVCEETWGPAVGCYKAITPCGEYCVECDFDNTDGLVGTATCDQCVDGLFVNSSGECEICPDQCATCSDSSTCIDCHDGFYEDSGDCLACDLNCKTCSGGSASDCTSCYSASEDLTGLSDAEIKAEKHFNRIRRKQNKSLSNNPGVCICDSGYIHERTLQCEEACPLTLGQNSDFVCSNENAPYQQQFEPDLTVFDTSSWASGRPPSQHTGRGAYFNGMQWLEWLDFVPSAELYLEFWYRPNGDNNGVLMHFDFLAYPDDWANHNCGPEHLHDDDFLLTYDTCWEYADPVPYAIAWHSVGVTVSETMLHSTIIDGNVVHTQQEDFIMAPKWDNSNSFWWGSYRGSTYNNFEGFIYGFRYSAWDASLISASCDQNGYDWCQPVFSDVAINLVSCGPNEYVVNIEFGCLPCHETCTICELDTACALPCHEDCLTCNGPGSNECITCNPGAHRTNTDDSQSCCTCDEGLYGEPYDCRHVCYDASCEYCVGPYPHDCLVCSENHEFVYTEDEDAHFCEYCFDNDFKQSVCGPRDITGLRLSYLESPEFYENSVCTCEIGEWLHDGRCVRCPKGCAECKQSTVHCRSECLSCEWGYVNHGGICVEECPTGFYAHTWFEATTCTKHDTPPIYSFTMTVATDGFWNRSMTYSKAANSASDLNLVVAYDVVLYGGANEWAIERDDPYPIDDRGYYFNGCDQFLTFNREYIWTRISVTQYWIAPHTDGTLFSNSDPREHDFGEVYYAEIIENGKLGYVNTLETKYLFDNSPVTFFEWQMVSFEVYDTVQMFGDTPPNGTGLHVRVNGVETDQVSMCEYPVGITGNRSHFGAIEDHEVMKDWFKGFLWKIQSDCEVDTTWMTDGANCDGVCLRCPDGVGPTCLGICDFDYFWCEGRCNHCPYWCREGCQSDGGC